MMKEQGENLCIGENSNILCENVSIGRNVNIGNDVLIRCKELLMGDNVEVGLQTEDNFRNVAGVRINVDTLVIGSNTKIGREVLIKGGSIEFGSDCTVRDEVTINVTKKLRIGNRSTIGLNFQISGVDIEIGDELWSLDNGIIGGGSAFEVHSKLRIGDRCHLGRHCFINTARPVYIGNEVGLGSQTSLYTHGAYQSILHGYPVEFGVIVIEDNCWLPGAIVNPNVHIGKGTVIGVGSVVTKDIPPGCLAVGVPARVIKRDTFPRELSSEERNNIMMAFLEAFGEILSDRFNVITNTNEDVVILNLSSSNIIAYKETLDSDFLQAVFNNHIDRVIILFFDHTQIVKDIYDTKYTFFDLGKLVIEGVADDLSERLRNQLRRYGVRFKYLPRDATYAPWEELQWL